MHWGGPFEILDPPGIGYASGTWSEGGAILAEPLERQIKYLSNLQGRRLRAAVDSETWRCAMARCSLDAASSSLSLKQHRKSSQRSTAVEKNPCDCLAERMQVLGCTRLIPSTERPRGKSSRQIGFLNIRLRFTAEIETLG